MPEPSHHQLLVPKATAKKKITAQIKKGREILAFLSQPAFDIPFPEAVKQAEDRQTKWAKYTIDLLKVLIRDHDYLIHVEFGSALSQYPPNQDPVEAFQEQMNKRIQCLESIVERLPLFPLAVAMPSRQQSKENRILHRHEVASHDIEHMKVFISWSGDLSHRIALILKDWLPSALEYVEPWVSSEDIHKGARWSPELTRELEITHSGVICLVPNNLKEPWLMFEAGALSKSVAARIHPFLVGVDPRELPGPLAQFQATCFSKDDIRKLIHSLNSEAGKAILSRENVDHAFEFCWPILEKQLEPLATEVLKGLNGAPADHSETKKNQPSLTATIRLKPPDCEKTQVGPFNPIPALSPIGECYYLRIWVENKGGQRAEKVQVFVSRLQKKHADGLFKDVNSFLPMNLTWSHLSPPQTFADGISPEMGMHCNFGHILDPVYRERLMPPTPPQFVKGRTILELDLQVQPNTLSHLILEGHYRFFVKVAAANSHPIEKCWDLNFTGKWFSEEDKMFSEGISIVPLILRSGS